MEPENNNLDTAQPTILTPKFDWYQTDSNIVVTVMVKNVSPEELTTNYEEKTLEVLILRTSGEEHKLHLSLSHNINPARCSTKIMSTKIECKLAKVEGIRWNRLQGEDDAPTQVMSSAPSEDVGHKYPSSAHYTRDWDKVVADINEEEKKEEPQGEAALNSLFQKIYKDGNDEVRKAMNKSFVESGGTVLSTNWSDIGSKQVEIQPPDGMEYKKYET